MAVKTYNPTTPSRREMTWYDFGMLDTVRPEKHLTTFLGKNAWRNNQGRVTARHRWWWHKKLYRAVDFRWYDKLNIPATVSSIQYDPYRTAWIALVFFADGEKRYVLAWKGCKKGDVVLCWSDALLKPGNRKQLKDIPDGFTVFNLEFLPQTKAKLIRSAGQSWTISWRDEEKKLVYVKLPSGEVRMFYETCWATIWIVSNDDHKNIVLWKAWRSRWMGRKPYVLGKSMNPVDHPHGGGEGHTDLWLRYPKAFNGRPVPPGKKTRKSKKSSNKFIAQRRKTRFK